ncbi:MAG: hypothetical protein JNM80_10490 [Phycisphaerae bacterium]|nr:hypothetical protein [Phycisphaerae bacterium]
MFLALVQVGIASGHLVECLEPILKEVTVPPPPDDLDYLEPPEFDWPPGQLSDTTNAAIIDRRNAAPAHHRRWFHAYDIYHRAHFRWRTAIEGARAALPDAQSELDAGPTSPFDRPTIQIASILSAMGGAIVNPMMAGPYPTMNSPNAPAELRRRASELTTWENKLRPLAHMKKSERTPEANAISSGQADLQQHPTIRLFHALNGLHQVCVNVGAFRDLSEGRKSKRKAWIDAQNALAKIDVRAAVERADEPPPMTEPAENTRVLRELLTSGLQFCSQANEALAAKGGEALDAALAPGTSVHATEIGMKVNDAEDLFVRLDSALRDPTVVMDSSLEEMSKLEDWFASARERLGVVMAQRGLVMTPEVKRQRKRRAKRTPTKKKRKPKRSRKPKPRAGRGASRSKPAKKGLPKDKQQELNELDKRTPPLTKGDGKWVPSKVAAKMEGVEVGTLATYRHLGLKNDALTLGQDRDGRVWRKVGGKSARPWYFKPTLQNAGKKSPPQP